MVTFWIYAGKSGTTLMQVKSIAECANNSIWQSAILLTLSKLPFVIKIFGLSLFVLPFYTRSGFTVFDKKMNTFT